MPPMRPRRNTLPLLHSPRIPAPPYTRTTSKVRSSNEEGCGTHKEHTLNFIIKSDIPLPQSVLNQHKKKIHQWFNHHVQENEIPPYQFYYNGHLVSLSFTIIQKERKEITTIISIILSTIVLVLSVGVLTYYAYMS